MFFCCRLFGSNPLLTLSSPLSQYLPCLSFSLSPFCVAGTVCFEKVMGRKGLSQIGRHQKNVGLLPYSPCKAPRNSTSWALFVAKCSEIRFVCYAKISKIAYLAKGFDSGAGIEKQRTFRQFLPPLAQAPK
jgi:hypothetical protein